MRRPWNPRLLWGAFACLVLISIVAFMWHRHGVPHQKWERISKEELRRFSDLPPALDVIDALRDVAATGRLPVLTIVNTAFLPFAHSWLCNTERMGVHAQLVVVTTDERSRAALARRWPAVRVRQLTMESELNAGYEWYSSGYWLITYARVKLFEQLLARGVSFLHVEVDSVWMRDGVGAVRAHRDRDIVTARLGGIIELDNYTAGFMFVNATRRATAVWRDVLATMERVPGSLEQDVLDGLCKSRRAGVRCAHFAYADIADGIYYKRSEEERARVSPDPCVINNNWIIGIRPKIERARLHKHWFLLDDGEGDSAQCDAANVASVVRDEPC